MWQLTIIGNNKFILFLKNIEHCLRQQTDALLALNNDELSIGCVLKDVTKVLKVLNKVLAESIVLYYKENYIVKNNLFNYLSSELKQPLIKCLVLLNFNDDVNFVVNSLGLNEGGFINLDSFFNFKLKNLKQNWNQLVGILKSSTSFIKSNTLLDILKFLVSVLEPKTQCVDVCYVCGKFVVSDESNNILVFKNSSNHELNLITGLITLAPKTINLHCAEVLSNNTFKLIYYIFNKKVNLLVWKVLTLFVVWNYN